MGRDDDVVDARHGASIRDALHLPQPPGSRNRDHHHSGSPRLSLQRGELHAERLPQHDLLQGHAVITEPQHRAASPADRSGREFDQVYAVPPPETQLGVNRTGAQPQGRRRVLGGVHHGFLDLGGVPRRRDVDRLFEKRTVQGVGLVEQRQDLQPTIDEQPFERHFRPRDEPFDQKLP